MKARSKALIGFHFAGLAQELARLGIGGDGIASREDLFRAEETEPGLQGLQAVSRVAQPAEGEFTEALTCPREQVTPLV